MKPRFTWKGKKMEDRYYVMIGNCYVSFLGLFHEPTMRADYHKATPYLTYSRADDEAKRRGLKEYKIVKRYL